LALNRKGRTYAVLSSLRRNAIRVCKRLRRVHPTAYVHRTADVSRDLVAEEWVFIGPRVRIDPLVTIGRYTMVAADVSIIGDDHVWNVPGVPMQFAGRPTQQPTVIGRDVWIGQGAMIRRGVEIGEGSIIGAHAVVTADVEPYQIMGGVPARLISVRFQKSSDIRSHSSIVNGPVLKRNPAAPLLTASDGQ